MKRSLKKESAGQRFRRALAREKPLQIPGVIHAYAALLAEQAGFRALYLSGAGVANASHGIPDLGWTTLEDVLADLRQITRRTSLPVLVDIDTGWGNMGRTIREMIRAGAAAVHLEDQVAAKRCGHRPGKKLVSIPEMCERIGRAVKAKSDPHFVIMARTDAVAVEGLEPAIQRAQCYVKAGADAIFAEALTSREQYAKFCSAVKVPVLANMTEFGVSPLLTARELKKTGVRMVLYPLSAFRAMNQAATRVYQTLRKEGIQKRVLKIMQTRKELYATLDYHRLERMQDATGRIRAR